VSEIDIHVQVNMKSTRIYVRVDGAPIMVRKQMIVFLCLDTEMEYCMGFEAPTGMTIYITVLRLMPPCSLVGDYSVFHRNTLSCNELH
jgi:hypothetical protein